MSFAVSDIAEPATASNDVATLQRPVHRQLQLGWKAAVGFPLAVYAASRLLVFLAMHIGRQLSDPWLSYSDMLRSWDGVNYLDIAISGYPDHLLLHGNDIQASVHGFFPAYPMLGRLVDVVLPGGTLVAMATIALLGGAAATVLLWQIALTLYDKKAADASVLLFCFFPGSFAFSFAYAEGLQYACVAATILLAVRKKLLWAALFSALATATRPSSLALGLIFGMLLLEAVWHRAHIGKALLALVVSVSGFIGYCLFLYFRVGDFFAWFRVERSGFNEGMDAPGSRGLGIVRDFIASDFNSAPGMFTTLFLVMMATMLVTAFLPGLPVWLRIYIIGCLYFPFAAFVAPFSPRLMLSAFPALIVLAKRLSANAIAIAVAVFAALLVTLTAAYGTMEELPFRMWAP